MSFARLALLTGFAAACSSPRPPASTASAPAAAEGVADAAPVSPASAVADAAPASGGSPSDEDLERALAAANSKLEACRTAGLSQNARLSGHVRLKVRVATDGRVEGVDDQGSTLPSPTVIACFEDALRELQLPRDVHPYEIVKSYTVLPPPDVWPTARDRDAGGAH